VTGKSVTSSSRVWRAEAPSNIALIKYMGKTDHAENRPTNTSLSYTLSHLRSVVELEAVSGADRWEPLVSYEARRLEPIHLEGKGLARFLAHVARVKRMYGVEQGFVVRSANDFPSDCGLASSASSFAALTMAALDALSALQGEQAPSAGDAQALSRQGSGSSCRSFFAPWSLWDEKGARGVDELRDLRFKHQVIVVDEAKKAVSSSEAHRRVVTSSLFAGRPERAEARVRELVAALRDGRWSEAFEITWAEFWDMHALFETSRPSFGYMTEGSLAALRFVRGQSWDRHGIGPLVTMDAGPNVHLLHLPTEEGRLFALEVEKHFAGRYRVIGEPWAGALA